MTTKYEKFTSFLDASLWVERHLDECRANDWRVSFVSLKFSKQLGFYHAMVSYHE